MPTPLETRDTRIDSSQQPFVHVDTRDGEAIRLTWVPVSPTAPGWAGEPRVRINKVKPMAAWSGDLRCLGHGWQTSSGRWYS